MPSVQQAIESFRQAALQPEQWSAALESLARAFRSDGATLILRPTGPHSVAVSTSCLPFVEEYLSTALDNPREQRVDPRAEQAFMPDFAYFTPREIAANSFYQEYLVPRGLAWNAAAALQGDLMITLKRSQQRGPYDGADLAALDHALPWLRATSAVACAAWRSGFIGELTAFERLGRGAILLDAQAHVLEYNACVAFGDGLDIQDGVLQATRPSERQSLRAFLSALLADMRLDRPAPAGSLAISRPSGARPWLIDGIACTAALRSLHSRAAVLLLVTDPNRRARPSPQALTALFGLTPTECELARDLAAGFSLQEIAERRGISLGHARQRLQVVFGKTGTSRQGELVALLTRLSG